MLNLRFLKEKKLPLIDAYAIHLWFVFLLVIKAQDLEVANESNGVCS